MINKIVYQSVTHPKITTSLWFIACVFFVFFSQQLKLDALPDPTSNQVLILTRAPGLTPEEVELRITKPIETSLGGIPGLKQHRSLSRYGISSITVIFEDSVDLFFARQQINERLLLVRDMLPPETPAPEVGPMTGGLGEIYHFTINSPQRDSSELLELANFKIAPLLRSVKGVVEVNTWGGQQHTLVIQANPARMAARGLTLDMLKTGIQNSIGTQPGASLADHKHQILIRGIYLPNNPSDLAQTIITRDQNNLPIALADVATVYFGDMPRLGAATQNGKGETVYVMAQMLTGENALQVTQRIESQIPLIQKELPPDVHLETVYNRATLVSATKKTVFKNLIEGALLVVLVLLTLLGNFRAGLLVAITIPVAMLGTTAAMALMGIPGNLMSLGALDFGLLVDGAIVMVENTMHHVQHQTSHASWREKIRETTSHIAGPIFSGIVIILIVYLPILSMTGVDGKLFKPMAISVVCALTTAILFTLTFIPAVLPNLLSEKNQLKTPKIMVGLQKRYERLLQQCVQSPRMIFSFSMIALVCAGILVFNLGTELTPQLDEGDLVLQTTRLPDIQLETSIDDTLKLEQFLKKTFPEIHSITSRIGSPSVATDVMGVDQADIFIQLNPPATWRESFHEDKSILIESMRTAIHRIETETEIAFTQPIQMRFNELLGGATTDVVLSIYGDELHTLWSIANRIHTLLKQIPDVDDPRILAPPDVSQFEIQPIPIAARQHQLTVSEILQAVRGLRLGIPVGMSYNGIVPIPIVLTLGDIPSSWNVSQSMLPTPSGALVPLQAVANIQEKNTPSMIQHDQGNRRILIGFNVSNQDLKGIVQQAESVIQTSVSMPHGYHVEWGGQIAQLEEASNRLRIVIPVVLLLICLVLFLTFKRFNLVFILLTHVPFACIGGLIALFLRHMPISLSAMIGFIALSGVAVMNGVVLLTQLKHLEQNHMPAHEAIVLAAQQRMAPVTMTALVAALGFVPMMLGHGIGAEVQKPLATVVVGGLISSTVLTLLILPSLYPHIQRALNKFSTKYRM